MSHPEKLRLTGGQALARCLVPEGVPFVFGIAGGKLMHFMRAIAEQPSIRYVGVRHEAAAGMMASAVYAATGRVAVAIGEVGPGAINLVSGIGGAFNNNLAMLAITSNNQRMAAYPGRGTLMELDTQAVFRPVTKWNAVVMDGRRIPELVRRAFREALSGRPGPVHLDVPQDVLMEEHEYDAADFETPAAQYRLLAAPHPRPADIARAAALLRKAERPVLLAGGGLARSGNSTAFRDIAALLDAPATATQMGIGAVDPADPHFIGHGGTIGGSAITRALREADLVLAVGCRFSSWLWDAEGPLARDRRMIQIDTDPAAIGRVGHLEVGLLGDAASVLDDLLAELRATPHKAAPSNHAWLAGLREDLAAHHAKLDAMAAERTPVMHPAALARAIGEAMPDDALATYDGGHTSFWSNDLTPVSPARTRCHEPGMAQLGFGTPWAVALKLAHPDRPVFNIIGDGAFGFTVQELDTARRYGLPIITVIHNNEAWGIIRIGQRRALDFELGTDLSGTDYAAIARGFGCRGETITQVEEIGPAIARALASDLPTVLDCRTRFEPHPGLPQFGASGSFGMPAGKLLHAAPGSSK